MTKESPVTIEKIHKNNLINMKSGPISYFDFRTIYHSILNNCLIPWLNSPTEQYKSHGHEMISILMLKMCDDSVPEPFYKTFKNVFSKLDISEQAEKSKYYLNF